MSTSSLSFLIHCTTLVLVLICTFSFAEKCNPQDKKVLLSIKNALNNPYNFISWDASLDCCEWNNVKCDETTYRIISLVLQEDKVSGQIPPAVGDLPFLQTLVFRHLTNVSGTIPAAIAKLKNLKFIRLSYLNLTGTAPDFLTTLPNLTYVDLSYNSLSGPLPASYYKIKGLEYLHLESNKFTGPIPNSLGLFSKDNPPLLSFARNQLTGTIPASFQKLNWQEIDLSRNKLEGDASMMFSSKTPYYRLDVSRNLLKFDLGKVKIPSGLVALDINHNSIYGSIPQAMASLPLQLLNMSYNSLCGKIPVGGRLQSNFDYYVYFHNKCLCGAPLPACK